MAMARSGVSSGGERSGAAAHLAALIGMAASVAAAEMAEAADADA